VDELVVQIIVRIFKARSPQVTFSEEVDFHVLVNADPCADVELPLIDQAGTLYILLKNKGLHLHVLDSFLAHLVKN
jgi:hypothetical protein